MKGTVATAAVDRGKETPPSELATAQSLLDWAESGWLAQAEIARLGVVLNTPVIIQSSLPAVETGFPKFPLYPSHFYADVVDRVEAHGLSTTSWLIGTRASAVLDHTETEADEYTPSPRATPDSDEAEADRLVDTEPTAGTTEFDSPRGALQIRQSRIRVVITSPCPRDDLGMIRDAVLMAIRGAVAAAAPPAEAAGLGADEVPDHMLAGAYLRQMMVVEEPGSGSGTCTAIFTFASFDDRPEVFTLEFQASLRGIDSAAAATGALAALVENDRIRLDTNTARWLFKNAGTLEEITARLDIQAHQPKHHRDSGLSLCSPATMTPPTEFSDDSGDWAAAEDLEPQSIMFCRRTADVSDPSAEKGAISVTAMTCAALSHVATCIASCFGGQSRKHTVSLSEDSVPPPPPPPLLVHEI